MFTIWTKDHCSYCTQAKALLDRKGLKYKEIDLTIDTLEEFQARTSYAKTVPQIFYHMGEEDEKLIGGFDKLGPFLDEWWDDKKD